MNKANNQNIPNPNEKQPGNSSDGLSDKSAEQNTVERFLQDITSTKHIPDLPDHKARADQPTLLEAIFNATVIRALNETVREFRLLGANFINKSVFIGLSKEFGQSPFLNTLKGETKNNLADLDRAHLRKLLHTHSEQKDKNKNLKNIKQDESKQSDKKIKQGDAKSKRESGLEEKAVEKEKPERISSQFNNINDENKQYNISDDIRTATDLELSLLPVAEHQVSLFQDLERVPSHDLGTTIKNQDKIMFSLDRLKHCIEQFSHGKILVIGDLLIDELLEGRPERISREAPVLILEHVDTMLIPGGAANTAHNVSALGGQCHAIGVCGEDEYANKLAQLLDQQKITHTLIRDPKRPTTVKTRILSKTHALMQQLLRLDRISREPISTAIESLLIKKLESIAEQYPVLILSDYRGGLITDQIIHACQKIALSRQLMLIVDAQDSFERFQNVSLITPNQPDTEQAVGYKITNKNELLQAGQDMLLLTGAKALLITQGKEGMTLFRRGDTPVSLPALNRSEVYDVSGAGDTVVATIALALSTGASLPEAIVLGNIAASIVVKKPGTAVTDQKELLEILPTIKLPV